MNDEAQPEVGLNSDQIEIQNIQRPINPSNSDRVQVEIVQNGSMLNPVHLSLDNNENAMHVAPRNEQNLNMINPDVQPQQNNFHTSNQLAGPAEQSIQNQAITGEILNEPHQIIHIDPNFTPDGRRIPLSELEKFLVKCFEDNMVLHKPNITTVAFIIVTTAFSILICIATSTEQPNLTIIIYGYWIDIIVELILLLMYVKASDMLIIKYSNWAILPWLMKLIMTASVSADLYRNTDYSLYICFLVLLPCFFNMSANFCYHRITLLGFCTSLVLSIAEILVVIKLFSRAGFPVRAIFDYLFYFFIVMVFFTGIIFLVSTCGIICHCCNPNRRQIPLRFKITQWFYGIDTMFEILICFYFGNFIDNYNEYKFYSNIKTTDSSFSTSQIENSFNETQKFRKSLFALMIAASGYIFIRMLLCFYLTFGLMPIQINRNRGGFQGHDHQPKVEKPSGASSVLNLFRINTNYFSTQAAQSDQEAEVDKKQEGDESCSICFSKLPNCIIMDCKHGGICETCAFDCMKKSIQCPFCRQDITKVCVVEKMSEAQYRVLKEIKP